MTTAWSHLPNAIHIDRVLASVRADPMAWSMVRKLDFNKVDSYCYTAVERFNLHVEWRTVWDTNSNYLSSLGLDWNDMTNARWSSWMALAVLIKGDDCVYMLESEPGELAILAAFGDPRAILLLPACIVFHSIKTIA